MFKKLEENLKLLKEEKKMEFEYQIYDKENHYHGHPIYSKGSF